MSGEMTDLRPLMEERRVIVNDKGGYKICTRVRDYRIRFDKTTLGLRSQVMEDIQGGFVPIGGIAVTDGAFLQAMYKDHDS